jgi:hypothetical protein
MALDWYLRRRYSVLLLAMFLVFVVHPLLGDIDLARWLYDLLFTAVFLAVFPVLFAHRGRRLAAVCLGLPTLVANWTGYAIPGVAPAPLAVFYHVAAAVFLGVTAAAILQTILGAKAISGDSLAGACCGYLLAGAAFGHLYCALEWVLPGSFRGPAELMSRLGDGYLRRPLLMYFSFTTLTTVGYGDIVPATPTARGLACLEAVIGQFYIAVVMAELIGLKVSQTVGGRRSDPQ